MKRIIPCNGKAAHFTRPGGARLAFASSSGKLPFATVAAVPTICTRAQRAAS